jgi:GH15 family glucan-1,4-alpha-glucosidase
MPTSQPPSSVFAPPAPAPLPASQIPSESFVTGNERILATVKTGQVTTDGVFGLAGLFAPGKHDRSLVQSSRAMLLVDGQWRQPVDTEQHSVIQRRGYEAASNIITMTWRAGPLTVRERYFVPPDLDLVIHQVQVQNDSPQPVQAQLVAVLSPHLGGGAAYRKGLCRSAHYDQRAGVAFVQDARGAVLTYGFDRAADHWQVGQVCGPSDVFFDLEDLALSNVSQQRDALVHLALALDAGTLGPGRQWQTELTVGRFQDMAAAHDALARYHARQAQWLDDTRRWWSQWLAQGIAPLTLRDLGPRLADLDQTSRIMLKTHQAQTGVIIVGSTASDYQGAISARNGCYCLRAIDRLGYHDDAARGLAFFTQFKLGDDRFCSPDENDQLGTIIHCFRQHHELTRDTDFLAAHYPGLRRFADAIIELVDPRLGLIYSERAIHEFVAVERGYETYVNVMAYRGLEDAAWLAAELMQMEESARFAEHARRLRQAILGQLYCPREGTFTKRIYQGQRINMPAVSMLTPALFGVLDAHDPRVTSTLRFLLERIWDPTIGGLYRYPLHLQPWDEIPYGGPWITYTCWLARVHLKRGELEQARQCLQWVVDHAPADSNLLPEHFSIAHQGRRGFHRVYYEPVLAESWATAEFLVTALDYQAAMRGDVPGQSLRSDAHAMA